MRGEKKIKNKKKHAPPPPHLISREALAALGNDKVLAKPS